MQNQRLDSSGLDDSGADSSMTGLEIRYFSLAQLPRSVYRLRSLQKGKNWSWSESVGFLQIGQLHFMRVRRRAANVRVALEECLALRPAEASAAIRVGD